MGQYATAQRKRPWPAQTKLPSSTLALQLRDDVERFVSSFGAVPRVLQLIAQLRWAHRQRVRLHDLRALVPAVLQSFPLSELCPVPAPSRRSSDPTAASSAAGQVAVWQQNAAAWVERLGRQYPLYRDVVQPVQLAVQELRYGLALMAGSATLAPHQPAARLAPVLARLMAFPRAAAAKAGGASSEAGPLQLDNPQVQQAVADAASAAAEARGSAAAASGDPAEQAKRAAYTAAMSARLQLLRCSLAAAARDVEATRLGASSSTAATSAGAVVEARARLHAIFMGERRRQVAPNMLRIAIPASLSCNPAILAAIHPPEG